MDWSPRLVRVRDADRIAAVTLGHPLLDDYLEFVGARARPNTWLAVAYDLKVFFSIIAKEPVEVTTADVFAFMAEQRLPRRGANVVRLEDGERGLAARTIKRRLSSVSGLFSYLQARGDAGITTNPVPRGLSSRRPTRLKGARSVPLIRAPRTLPRVLTAGEVDAFVATLRTNRDRAMVWAMLFGGLRRCEVCGLQLKDINPGERRLFVRAGKGGHQRLVSISPRFFDGLDAYLGGERPQGLEHDFTFVVLKGPNRGRPLSSAGVDEIVRAARRRAGIAQLTCHQLRHTCLTRLREAGMALEAIQSQAGHRSIESTRVYLELADGWVAEEYRRTMAAIDASVEDSEAST